MAGYLAITCDTQAPYIHTEFSPADWQITRTQTAGITVGIVWGSMRRPLALPKLDHRQFFYLRFPNPWLERADFVLRAPFVLLPWFHIWWWRMGHSSYSSAVQPHPARLYAGGKLFFAHDNSPLSDGTPSSRAGEDIWRDPKKDPPGWYVTPSASLRLGS